METVLTIIAIVAILAVLVLMFIYKRKTLMEWLLKAVVIAEEELGSDTGAEKLQLVHDRLVARFPIVGRILPFAIFSNLVDKALDLMKGELEKALQRYEENLGQN